MTCLIHGVLSHWTEIFAVRHQSCCVAAARIPLPPLPPVNAYLAHHNLQLAAASPATDYQGGLDGLVEFDQLLVEDMCASIAGLIDSLPPIDEMKHHFERKMKLGKSKPRLKNGGILPAAGLIVF
ncbi:hypothetical protein K438DRAFT_2102947 [Mycena galopus ATCC 62051]|nr:hypothetical protein K438DRAFT_2102947 [Mycena galopus ATCC 62051]